MKRPFWPTAPTLGLGKKLIVFYRGIFTGKIPVFYQYFTTGLRAGILAGKLPWSRALLLQHGSGNLVIPRGFGSKCMRLFAQGFPNLDNTVLSKCSLYVPSP